MSKYDSMKAVAEDFNNANNVLEMFNDGNNFPFIYASWTPEKMSVQVLNYLLNSGIELKRTKRDNKEFPTQYSVEIDGVLFFELSEEPFEKEVAT